MTVDLATRPVPTLVAPSQRRMSFSEKLKYADFLAASDLLPAQYRRKPANVLWAMEYGDAVGLETVVAINGVHVIEGKPSPAAATAAALVRSQGHKLHVWFDPHAEGTQFGKAYAELIRRDDPDFTFRGEWSVEDAVRAEICKVIDGQIVHRTSNGKTGNYQKFPKAMCKARALGEVCRDGAQDVLLGLIYLAEEHPDVELSDSGQIVSSDWESPAARDFPGPVRTSDLTDRPAEARPLTDHVIQEADVDDVTEAVSSQLPLTKRTGNAMFALFSEAGLGGRDEVTRKRRIRVSELLSGREGLTSSNDLTEDDGLVIEHALRAQGDQVAEFVRDLLADDDAQRATDTTE